MEVSNVNSVEVRRQPKPNNIFTVPYEWGSAEFYKWWCVFLRPFVKLTNREADVMASLLKHRWELSKSISDSAILDTMIMSESVKKDVIKECNITLQYFYVVMNNLRKNNIIKNNVIDPRLIPNQRDSDNGIFQLLILFKEKAPKNDLQRNN